MSEKQKILDYFTIQQEIGHNLIKPIFLIYGEDSFLQYTILEQFKTQFSRQKKQVIYETFYGEDLDFRLLADSLYNLPLGFTVEVLQCVIIKQLEKIKNHLAQKLDTLMENLSLEQSNRLILLFANTKKLPENINLEKIEKYGSIVALPKSNRAQIRQLIRKKCGAEQKVITEEAIYYLQNITDNDAGLISNELEKLFCFLGKSETKITKDHILENMYGVQGGNIFELVDAIGERETNKAINILRKLLNNDEYYPLQILAMINRQFRLISRAKLFPEDLKVIRGDTKLPLFLIQNIIKQSQKYKPAELKKSYAILLDIEIKLKTGLLQPGMVLEQLIIQLTNGDNFNSF